MTKREACNAMSVKDTSLLQEGDWLGTWSLFPSYWLPYHALTLLCHGEDVLDGDGVWNVARVLSVVSLHEV